VALRTKIHVVPWWSLLIPTKYTAIQIFFFTPPSQAPSCDSCQFSLPLLAQIYAPLSDEQVSGRGEYDRVLYVWGCGRKACTNKTTKVVRALKKNAEWAENLARWRKMDEARQIEEGAQDASNPFTVVFIHLMRQGRASDCRTD
jgi:hypothetical protein